MRKISYPIQKLCLSKQEQGLDLIIEGDQPTRSLTDDLQCDCPFFQKWQLPCAHEKFVGGVLDQDNIWDRYAFMFCENGFEIYEGMEKTYSTREVFEEIGAPTKRRLQVSEKFPV